MIHSQIRRFSILLFTGIAFLFSSNHAALSIESTASAQLNVKQNIKRPRIALVLGGGGLRGFAHIGVLKVLRNEHIPIDMIVGTSIGALIGGLYCTGKDPDELFNIGTRKLIHAYYSAPLVVQLISLPINLFTFKPPLGLYRGNVLAKAIDQIAGPDKQEIANLQPTFAAVATDLVDAVPYIINKGDLGKALQASSAIPFVRRPVRLDNRLFVDGGVVANIPVKEARKLGAEFIIAVDIDERLERIDAQQFEHRLGLIPSRVIGLVLTKIDEGQKQEADVFIHPEVSGISLLSKKLSDAKVATQAGEEAANQMIPEIKAKLAEFQTAYPNVDSSP